MKAQAMLKIRKASVEDVPLILAFIRELAEYEREPNAVRATEDLIEDFGEAFEAIRTVASIP